MSCCFFHHTATTVFYTLSLHDALPICGGSQYRHAGCRPQCPSWGKLLPARSRPDRAFRHGPAAALSRNARSGRSEEHTSELQSHSDLVCLLLLEKKKR